MIRHLRTSSVMFAFIVFALFALCHVPAFAGNNSIGEEIDSSEEPYFENKKNLPVKCSVTKKEVLRLGLEHGVDLNRVVYTDLVPYDNNGDNTFILVWGVVENILDEFIVTYFDPGTGQFFAQEVAHEGLRHRLIDLQVDNVIESGLSVRTINVYESFPWGWNLPFCSSMYVSCGYGCGYHTGSSYYATDWNLSGDKDCGNTLAAPASGWAMHTGWYNSAHGNTVVVKGGNAGSGKNYIWRVSHLNSVSIIAGWWIDQGRNVGTIGTTGSTSTGCHIHFEVWRGTVSGGTPSGETVPISNWPSSGDSVDGYDGSTGTSNCFTSGNNCSSGDTCP